MEYTIGASIISAFVILGAIIGMHYLVKVQRLTHEYMMVEIHDTESEEDPRSEHDESAEGGEAVDEESGEVDEESGEEDEEDDEVGELQSLGKPYQLEKVDSAGTNKEAFEIEYVG
uniref:Uncharacterized protein n=2 Tax=Ditylum brightwellii TaxID=49249 RepID=A0A7S4VY40_9STRA|mmetsp:Transcript_24601/g.32784  ORF Transcript_24601/g.32784 Transcript_24601/m.32784 type:complete len:116 (-) Transcript_24601:416-763(-)